MLVNILVIEPVGADCVVPWFGWVERWVFYWAVAVYAFWVALALVWLVLGGYEAYDYECMVHIFLILVNISISWFVYYSNLFWGKGVGPVVLVGPCLGGRSSPIILLSAFSLLQSIVWFTMALIMEGFGDENNEGWC